VEQKANRLEICLDLLGSLEIELVFLDKVITGAEPRVFDYDPENKREIAEWHTKSSPRPKKARVSRLLFSTAVALCTKNFFLQDRQLITPSKKMSWNDFENGSSEPERTLQTTGCCTTIMHQYTLCFQFENLWRRKTFPYHMIGHPHCVYL
jgi:hypothetical protein